MLLSQQFVDLIIQVSDPKLSEASVLYLRDLFRNFADDLKSVEHNFRTRASKFLFSCLSSEHNNLVNRIYSLIGL